MRHFRFAGIVTASVGCLVALSQTAVSSDIVGLYKGKCYDSVVEKHRKCRIVISEETLSFRFRNKTLSIPTSQITSIDEESDRRLSAATILVSPFFKKKVREFTIGYRNDDGRAGIASFRVKKRRATALRTALVEVTNRLPGESAE